LCPQRWSGDAGGTPGAELVTAVRAGEAVPVSTTAGASRRIGDPALLRAAYLASRIALWASTLLTVGSRPRLYDAAPTASA
jgi:hypothetical protein